MSEESQAAESAEAAQSAVETESSSPPPWGDDFNPERAWQTITHLRGREKELESEAKTWKRFREDEEFRRTQLGELGYEFDEGTDDESDYEDEDDEKPEPARDPRVDELIAERNAERFDRDLKRFAGDRDISDLGRRAITQLTFEKGGNPQALENAVKAWIEYEDGLREAAVRERPKPPTPPSVPQPGRAGEQEFDRKSATAAQRRTNREARLAAAIEGANQE